MGFVIFLIVVVGLWVLYKMSHYNDSPWVKNRIKNRTEDQKAVIRYFCNDPACLSKKPISDAEYDAMIKKYLSANDFRKKALAKIGLDEDEVKEIEPIHFEGFRFGKDVLSKRCDDGIWRSSKYQVSWLFFSNTQIYIYQDTFCMDEDSRSETTQEYFYKDVTNFMTSSDREETPVYDKDKKETVLENVDTNRFAISVYGDKLYCAMKQNSNTERAIQGMKAKLREKKNA